MLLVENQMEYSILNRSSHQSCSVKNGALKNFTKVTWGKPVPESLF